jgi:peptidoglycan/xylan/chitin deacetylase (PgdA/CDA1 family)
MHKRSFLNYCLIAAVVSAFVILIAGVAFFVVADEKKNKHASPYANNEVAADESVPLTFTLNGDAVMDWPVGEDFVDPGAYAFDELEGDISKNVTVESNVNKDVIGTYTCFYYITDVDNTRLSLSRTVNVKDMTPPNISISGANVYLRRGTQYVDPGYNAVDNLDGDITGNVEVSSNVDVNSIGVYTVTYNVKDSSNNPASSSRKVFVYEPQADVSTINPGNKIIYLTFDDGPYMYTKDLLDTLDKYNVKATFFVTNQYSAYQGLIGEEYRRGHTVAIHSYSHVYSNIYSSEEAYFNDLNAMREIIINQTGVAPSIVRFPGGTSNTVSARYCQGIMSKLVEDLNNTGYLYCDWNVSSGDAGETTSTEVVVSNVINGVSNHNVSYVLQHDIKKFSVDAVEDIIVWGLSNGYTFLPLTKSSPMSHFSPNN